MESIKKLKNSQSGKCLLIGAGLSVLDFDFSNISFDVARIAVNRIFVDVDIDFQVFTDPFFKEYHTKYPIEDNRILIGPKHIDFDRTNFNYEFEEDIYEGFHTGYHALQIAQYLGFDEIYLIGYDYYEQNNKVHYYEDNGITEITDREKNAIRTSFQKWIEDFNKINWTAKIYNCNPESNLKKFNFKEVS